MACLSIESRRTSLEVNKRSMKRSRGQRVDKNGIAVCLVWMGNDREPVEQKCKKRKLKTVLVFNRVVSC